MQLDHWNEFILSCIFSVSAPIGLAVRFRGVATTVLVPDNAASISRMQIGVGITDALNNNVSSEAFTMTEAIQHDMIVVQK
jgi:hypothetical protein